jgi:hypothetical protein
MKKLKNILQRSIKNHLTRKNKSIRKIKKDQIKNDQNGFNFKIIHLILIILFEY